MAVKARLPVLISVPHGGVKVPPEVAPLFSLTLADILRDGDTWAGYLYNLEDLVDTVHIFNPARAVVDVNRAPDDLPPANQDGVVKTLAADGLPVWKNRGGLAEKLVEKMLHRYYFPYHEGLKEASGRRSIKLGLDCHTMLARAPFVSAEPGKKRPLVCLGNLGDEKGEVVDGPVSAPPELLRRFGEALAHHFFRFAGDSDEGLVSLNDPFKGGFITRKHSTYGRIPWIQVEINRSLYLHGNPRTESPPGAVLERMAMLKYCFAAALEELFS